MKLFGGGGEADFENDFMRSRRQFGFAFCLMYELAEKERLQNFKSSILKS